MQSPYFTEEHELFRSAVREFFRQEVVPNLAEWEAKEQIPREIWQKMGAMDYLGALYPESVGGAGVDFFYSAVFIEELGRLGNGGFAAAVSVHSYMALNHIALAGSSFLQEKYLKPGLSGEKIGALAISEPNAGSDVQKISAKALSDGDFYIVNGSKVFITNGYYADFITTAVKTGEAVSLFVIDGNAEGLNRAKLKKMGWYSSDTAELFFENVKVPKENLIGEIGKGFYYIMESFALERLSAALMSVGAMDYILEITLKYMRERESFGKPISRFQALRHRMADLFTEVEACRQLVYYTCWLLNQNQTAIKECTMSKLKASELQKKVADECLQMFGGYGFMNEYPISAAYRDARAATIAGGTSEIMREIIAKITLDNVSYKSAYGK
ncbi:MAG: acyl-CoA dehydrogenase family protein [Acidobacteria bacterium]|jgi:alkylation response protein AidB-like acyl-CoA dehydrogenase|nr:acyl-CoA dehydrogenase family protein [Acidobacteriota bacterium]